MRRFLIRRSTPAAGGRTVRSGGRSHVHGIAADFTRVALVELLRCPHFSFGVTRAEVAALDRYLFSRKYLGC